MLRNMKLSLYELQMKRKLMNKFEIKSEMKLNYGIKYNIKKIIS
jgi:hypothetical protein